MENKLPKVFIVDDNITNLMLGRNLLKPYYNVYPLTSASALFSLLDKRLPDLILLDIEMPGMDGYEVLKTLKADERYESIPVIFLTAKSEERNELMGFELGAVDYISKPFSPSLLIKRVENHLLIQSQREIIRQHANDLAELVHEKTREILGLQNAVLSTVADLVEFHNGFTGGHHARTLLYMEAFLNEVIKSNLYINQTYNWNMDFILPSSQLHDVGKIAIPDSILNKPGRLNKEEQKILRTHVAVGMEAINRIMESAPYHHDFLIHAYKFVSSHHEQWNGNGYPAGLSGSEIPLEGRVMAIVDAYDGLTTWRPYKRALTHEEAVMNIQKEKGIKFDPNLVDIFLAAEDIKAITENNNAVTE